MKVVLDGGNGMAGPDGRPDPRRACRSSRCRPTGCPTANFPDHEPNPLLPENRQFIVTQVLREGADAGHRLGRRRRPLLLHRRHRRVRGRRLPDRAARRVDPRARSPGATILYDVRACRAVARHRRARRRARRDQPRRPRVLQDAHARGGRRVRRRGVRPLLLPRLLLRRLGHDPGAADPRAAVGRRARRCRELLAPYRASATSSRARSTPKWRTRTAKMNEIAERYSDGRDQLAGRGLGGLRRLAFQRAALEHRAAAAAQSRVARVARSTWR